MIPSKELALLWAFPLGIITPIRRLPLGPLSWLTCYLGLFLNVSIKPETISVTPRLPPYLRESHLPPSAADSLRNSSARAAWGALCICAKSPGAEQQLPPLLSPTQGTRPLHVAAVYRKERSIWMVVQIAPSSPQARRAVIAPDEVSRGRFWTL